MKAKLTNSIVTNEYQFQVEIDSVTYSAQIWLNQKGKFIDDIISYPNGDNLGLEGVEGEIREKILDYLDENWDKLVE